MIFFVSTCNKELRHSQKVFIYESTLSKYNIKPMYANYDIRLKNLSKIFRMKTLLDKLKYNDDADYYTEENYQEDNINNESK
jgi:hypothetical protein